MSSYGPDQSGSGEQRIGEGRQYSKLGSALERGIVTGLAIRAALDDQRGFVDVGAPDIYRSARYVAVLVGPFGQQLHRRGGNTRRSGPGVDNDVPRPCSQARSQCSVIRSIGMEHEHTRRYAAGNSTMQRSHIPTALNRFSDHGTANEASPTKYQEPHGPSMHSERLQLCGSSRGANTRSLTATRTFRSSAPTVDPSVTLERIFVARVCQALLDSPQAVPLTDVPKRQLPEAGVTSDLISVGYDVPGVVVTSALGLTVAVSQWVLGSCGGLLSRQQRTKT